MGNCLGTDVSAKYSAAGSTSLVSNSSTKVAEAEAKEAAAGALAYCSWLSLHLECRRLKDVDLLSKTDAMGVLFQWNDERWVEAGRTELIPNSLDPKFATTIKVLYNFEKLQRYKVMVVDVDKGQNPRNVDAADCEFLGTSEFTLSEVVTAPGKKLVRHMYDQEGKSIKSQMVMLAEETTSSKEKYRIRLAASNLKNLERLGTSDPFVQISRQQEDGREYLPVFTSKPVKNTLKPAWNEFLIRATQLNNGDMMRPLLLQVFDYEGSGHHRLMGQCEVSTERLQEMAMQQGALLSLQPPPGKPPGDYGTIQVPSFEVIVSPSFLDYLAGGSEIGFVVAVDFTASNGDPNNPISKHYFAGGPTQYELAIMGIGQILEYYDADKVFPMYGFGGKYQRNAVNHCFPMGAPPDSTCVGVQGLLQAYRHCLSHWKLSGPTHFAPVIRMATNMAQATVGASPPKYTVLLILTDGEILDMDDTVDAIIRASTVPLSILIVGIGNDSFANMKVLDSDDKKLRRGSRTAVRDIVQFVEFNRHAGNGVQLAQELLAELPGQFLEYMRLNNVKCPQPRLAAPTMAGPPPLPASIAGATAPPLPAPIAGP